jgi:hypothetical protein
MPAKPEAEVAATQADDNELTKTLRTSKEAGDLGAGLESNAPHRNEPLDIERSFLVVPFVACQWRRPASTARRTDEAERRGFRDIRFGVRLAIWPASAFTSDSEVVARSMKLQVDKWTQCVRSEAFGRGDALTLVMVK